MSHKQNQKNLPEVVVYIAVSVDGFIATRDGGLAWLDSVKMDGEDYGYTEFMKSIDAIAMGRNTYDVVRGFGAWPYEGKDVFVFTHRPIDPIGNEKAVSGSLKETLENLATRGVKRVYLDGGQLIRKGLQEGVIDRITLSIIPVLLGDGIPLFGNLDVQSKLKCLGAQHFASGLVQVSYQIKE